MISIDMEPQIKAPRVAPLEGVSTSTVAPVDVAHTYGSRHTWISLRDKPPQGIRVRGVENPQGFGINERRFIDMNSQRISVNDRDSDLIYSPQRAQSSQRSFLPFEIESEKILQERNGTRMTRIGRIFTDPRVSVSSAQSVFYRNHSLMKNPLSAFMCVDPLLINRAGGV